MTKIFSITEARHKLTGLPKEFSKEPETDAVAVTRRGKPVLAILPWTLYESLIESMEIMGDEALTASLRQSIKDIRNGRTYSMAEARRRLKL